MADNNYISKVTLPNFGTTGVTYYLKDIEARQMISGGISFSIVWTQTDYESSSAPSASKLATIPSGVKVYYNEGESYSTGTLTASSDTKAIFYLIYSPTQVGGSDKFDEYVTIEDGSTYFWEKIGDTRVDLTNVVTDVSVSGTDSVIGADSTFTITQPTIALATDGSSGTGKVQVVTGITSTSVSGDNVDALTGLGDPTTSNVVGENATFTVTQPTITPALESTSGTGKVGVITGVSATTTNIKATASGANTAWNSKDSVTALTGLGTPSTSKAVGKDATFTITQPTVALSTGATAGDGVISVATGITSVTQPTIALASNGSTATGRVQVLTGSTASTTNTDILKSIAVSNETLSFGAVTLSSTYLGATASGTAVTPTTTNIKATASGANTAWNNQKEVSAVTGYASPTTDTVIGTDSTFTITQPTIALATGATAGTGVISVATDASGTTEYLKATASSGNVAWNDQKTVAAVTGYASPTTDEVVGTGSTITVTPTKTYIKATASGANTAWNSKDTVTAVTGITVTKGTNE